MESEQEISGPQLKQEQTEPNESDNPEYDDNEADFNAAENNNGDNTDDDQPQALDIQQSPRQRTNGSLKRSSPPGSMLNKKIKQLSGGGGGHMTQNQHQSSLESLMQATGMELGNRFSPQTKRKKQDLGTSVSSSLNPPTVNPSLNSALNTSNFNQTTSSLFSILAGLTQQQTAHMQQQQQQQPKTNSAQLPQQPSQISRNAKPAHGANTLRNGNSNANNNNLINNLPMNSSLLTLLNEKISGNVANSLQLQLKKNLEPASKLQSSNARTGIQANNGPNYYQTSLGNGDSYNTGNNLRLSNGDSSFSSLDQFIESIAKKTCSNIGPVGISEAKKIIEKFTTWLMLSSQTIADHYVAPYAGDVIQQKPEISASDVILAYKMMQKSHPQ